MCGSEDLKKGTSWIDSSEEQWSKHFYTLGLSHQNPCFALESYQQGKVLQCFLCNHLPSNFVLFLVLLLLPHSCLAVTTLQGQYHTFHITQNLNKLFPWSQKTMSNIELFLEGKNGFKKSLNHVPKVIGSVHGRPVFPLGLKSFPPHYLFTFWDSLFSWNSKGKVMIKNGISLLTLKD